jgi:hypothetical protein
LLRLDRDRVLHLGQRLVLCLDPRPERPCLCPLRVQPRLCPLPVQPRLYPYPQRALWLEL